MTYVEAFELGETVTRAYRSKGPNLTSSRQTLTFHLLTFPQLYHSLLSTMFTFKIKVHEGPHHPNISLRFAIGVAAVALFIAVGLLASTFEHAAFHKRNESNLSSLMTQKWLDIAFVGADSSQLPLRHHILTSKQVFQPSRKMSEQNDATVSTMESISPIVMLTNEPSKLPTPSPKNASTDEPSEPPTNNKTQQVSCRTNS